MDELVHRRGRTDLRAVLMGFGDCLDDLKVQCTALGLDSHVHFTGRVGLDVIATYLSAAAIGLGPDQNTPLNNVSTMNKTMEYMAYALPSVSFDLVETRVSGGDAAIYVPSGDFEGFADAIEGLLDDPDAREKLGRAARERVATELDWQEQAKAYIGVFDEVLGRPVDEARRASWPFTADAGVLSPNRDYVDLDDEARYTAFLRDRGRPAVERAP
jgi:glycosyltransferase involved in cell wall biosynthesis